MTTMTDSVITGVNTGDSFQHHPAARFPTLNPVSWLQAHFAVGGFSPLQRLSGMLTAHMSRIAPRSGFTWHPHRGLEIFTYVVEGELYHEDSTGGRGTISAGEVQRMFSGDYIAHQELNLSDRPTRVIQIWFVPDRSARGLPPHYEQLALVDLPARTVGDGVVRDILGPTGAANGHVSARLTSTMLPAGGLAAVERPAVGEDLFLYFVDGGGTLETADRAAPLGLYDVLLATPDAGEIRLLAGAEPLNYLSFYLKPFIRHEKNSS